MKTLYVSDLDGHFLIRNFFEDAASVLHDLLSHKVCPIVYSFQDGTEKFSYVPQLCSPGMQDFLKTRKGDIREQAVVSTEALFRGDIFYFTCIDEREKLEPLHEKYRDSFHCVFHVDPYTRRQWLEIMPKAATKANAVMQLKTLLGCDRLVVFGDGANDLDMFRIADEAYAVENASEALKAIATGVIGSNEDDGVARWLKEHI